MRRLVPAAQPGDRVDVVSGVREVRQRSLEHADQDVPGHDEDAGQVHVDRAAPLLERHLGDPAGGHVAGVVDQHIDRAQGVLGRGHERRGLVPAGHVALDDRDLGAGAAQLLGELAGLVLLAEVVDRDARARGGEGRDHLAAEAAGAAGDERDAAGEVEGAHRSPPYHGARVPRRIWTVLFSVKNSMPSRPNSAP